MSNLTYGIDERPPFGVSVFLSVQHILTMFGATVAVPLLIAGAAGMSSSESMRLISAVWLAMGVSTLLQVIVGTRLPIIQGSSFSFIPSYLAVIGATASMGCAISMQYLTGAVIAGSLFEIALGWSGAFGRLRKYISPVVIGPVMTLIGLSLFAQGAPMAGQHWPLAAIVITCIFLFSQIFSRGIVPKKFQRYFGMFPILMAVALGWVLSFACSIAGFFGPGHPSFVDMGPLVSAPWFIVPYPMPWGVPKFSLGFALGILAGYIASMFESFGHYHAISAIAGIDYPDTRTISRGIGAEGIGCLIGGLFGGICSTSYGENIGAVVITKVASRYVITLAGVILIALSMIGKLCAFIASIPAPIVGALYCTLFGMIAAVGIQQTARADLTSDRNIMIIGFLLFMGLSLPVYMQQSPLVLQPPFEWVSDVVNGVFGTGMAVAVVLGLILDNIIPGTPKERGLSDR